MANELEKIQTPAGTYNIQDAGARTLISGLDDAKFNKSNIDTSIANPTSDTKVLSEKAVVDNYFNKSNIDTSMANPTSDSKVLSEKAVKDYVDDGLEDKANKDGIYPTMSVGEAESLKTSLGVLDKTPLSYQTVGGASDVTTGLQKLNKLVGCKVVKNQLVKNGNFADTSNWTNTNCSFSVANNKATILASAKDGYIVQTNIPILNHKYFCHVEITLLTATDQIQVYVNGGYGSAYTQAKTGKQIVEFIFTGVSGAGNYLTIRDRRTSDWDNVVIENVLIKDLNQRYGSNDVVNAIIGNDSATQVSKLIAFDTNILKDTTYDAGSFSSCKSAKLKTIDYNLWDEVIFRWGESLSILTGGTYVNANAFTSTLIRVFPNKVYGKYNETGASQIYYCFYDINGNFISGGASNDYFTSPNNAYWLRFSIQSYGTTYKNDVSIFSYWDGSRIGYEPHEEHIIDLPNVDLNGILKVDGDGNVYADGDELTPDGSGNSKRYDIVDLGTLNYLKQEGTNVFFYANIPNHKKASDTNIAANMICSKYPTVSQSVWYQNDGSIWDYTSSASLFVSIFDSTYASYTVEQFKAAMSGKYLIFELDTPTTLTADTFSPNFYGDDFGDMQFLDENDNIIDGLQGNEIFYKANIAGFAESVYAKVNGDPNDLVVQSDLTPFTNKDTQLLNALGGTLRQCLCVKESLDFNNTNVVDLGSLNWTYANSIFAVTKPSDMKLNTTDNVASKILCTKYSTTARDYVTTGDMNIAAKYEILVKDTTYTDATAFKAAMKGVLLAYEKASE